MATGRKATGRKKPSKATKSKKPSKTKKCKKPSRTEKGKKPRVRKCCPHCQDYMYCDDRGGCCEYCDYFVNSKCIYKSKKSKKIVTSDIGLAKSIELTDYRGDDFGIDDYAAYDINSE